MTGITPADQIAFLDHIQRLLGEGQFTATYKFALLLSLADLCVEKGQDTDASFVVATEALAEKFIQYYWRQIRPFPCGSGESVLLRQNTSKAPAVIRELEDFAARGATRLTELQQQPKAWRGLVARVRKTICEMPLGKLQTVGNTALPFLYDDSQARAGRVLETVELRPGVMFCLRKFHPLITDLVRGAWVRYVRRRNADVLGSPSDLNEFLFGSERAALQVYVPILREVQESQCFYCRREMTLEKTHVDHFIPWSRYPVDLAHNFVLAHATCNAAKADHLAAVAHLDQWVTRNREAGDHLAAAFLKARLLHDQTASSRIAQWAYRVSGDQPMTWIRRSEFEALPLSWESLFEAA